jgi:hypothetical protein
MGWCLESRTSSTRFGLVYRARHVVGHTLIQSRAEHCGYCCLLLLPAAAAAAAGPQPSSLSRESLLAEGGGPAVMDWEGTQQEAEEGETTCGPIQYAIADCSGVWIV